MVGFLATAFTVGACVSHALWTLIHECAHNLIFSKSYMNTLASIVANLPHLCPARFPFSDITSNTTPFKGSMNWTPTCPVIGRPA